MNDFTVLLIIATISGVLAEVFGTLIVSALNHAAKTLFAKWTRRKKRARTLRLKH